jgi:hypothetical protein
MRQEARYRYVLPLGITRTSTGTRVPGTALHIIPAVPMGGSHDMACR